MARQEAVTQETSGGEQQGQQAQNRQRALARAGYYPVSMAVTPADFFRMGPFSLMRRMSEEMDRVLGELTTNRGETGAVAWAPAIEVQQRDGSYVVQVELPGVKPDAVKVEVEDDQIVIQGERKFEKEETIEGVRLTERRYGRFYRAVPLPEGAMAGDAKATFDNGMLEITVPIEQKKGQRREIQVESRSGQSASGQDTKGPGTSGKAA